MIHVLEAAFCSVHTQSALFLCVGLCLHKEKLYAVKKAEYAHNILGLLC